MYKRIIVIVMSIILCFGTVIVEAQEQEKGRYLEISLDDDFADDSVIVTFTKYDSGINRKRSKSNFAEIEGETVEDLTYISDAKCKLVNTNDFRQIVKIKLKKKGKEEVIKAIRKLEKRKDIESVEPVYYFNSNNENITPLSTSSINEIYNQYALEKINIQDAWNITTGTRAVKVGIIDSGLAEHKFLNANVDYNMGWDFYNGNNITWDDNTSANGAHGTNVAGVVGVGVCKNVTLIPLQVQSADARFFDSVAIIKAINYASNNNIPIINCSFGFLGSSDASEAAIRNYGGLVVCSAGNDGNDNDIDNFMPAGLDLPNIISVAATDSYDNLWIRSNYGVLGVDLAAPGVNIYSTGRNDTIIGHNNNGTSLAAPFVTGVAALMLSVNPNLNAQQLKQMIINTVDIVPTLQVKY